MKRANALVLIFLLGLLPLSGCTGASGANGDLSAPPSEEAVFTGTILDIYDNSVLVEAAQGDAIRRSADQITFGTASLETLSAQVGALIRVTYTGEVMESYPAQVNAIHWEVMEAVTPGGGSVPEPTAAQYHRDDVYLRVLLPEGWTYHEIPDDEHNVQGVEGISFWPEAAPKLRINLESRNAPVGICGTGVTFTDLTFSSGYQATACTEEIGTDYWFLLIYAEPHQLHTVSCTASLDLWAEYEDDLMVILDSVSFEPDAAP